jgi:hypothetical protein
MSFGVQLRISCSNSLKMYFIMNPKIAMYNLIMLIIQKMDDVVGIHGIKKERCF